jgi:hypothetical protein
VIKTKNGMLVVIVIALVLLSFAALVPSFSQTDTQNEMTPGPNPEKEPYIAGSEDAFAWPPGDLPSTGNPQMQLVQLQAKPDSFNKINLEDANWLRSIIDKPGEWVSVTQESVLEYFAYYENARNHNSYIEVTFPDGSARYYEVVYTESP